MNAIGPLLDPANYDFSLMGLPRALIAFCGFAVPLWLYFKNRRSTLHQLYLFAVVPAFLWQFGYAWMIQAVDPEVAIFWSGIGQIGAYLLPSVIYGFSVIQTHSKRQLPLAFGALTLSFALGQLIYHPLLFAGVHRYAWGNFVMHGPLYIWVLLFFALTVAGFYFNLIRDYRATRSLQQKKMNWFFIVAFSCVYLGAFEFLPGYGFDVRPLGFLAVSIWSLLILWGIHHYQKTDLETIVAQTFSYLVISLSVFLSAVGFTALSQRILVGYINWNDIFVTGLALLAVFPVVNFSYRRIQNHLAKIFYQQRLRAHETLREFNDQLKELTNCQSLLHELVFTLRTTIGVERTAVYLKTPNAAAYLLQESSGGDAREPAVSAKHEAISWFTRTQDVMDRNHLIDLPAHHALRKMGIQLLDGIGYDFLIPLCINHDLLGFLALGRRLNGKSFDVSDVDLLKVLGQNAAVAISNALLFGELSEKNQTLHKLDREKTHFLANTAHELRTPLHGILGIGDALLEGVSGPLNNDQHHYVKLIHDSGKALAELVEKLLNLERMNARKTDCDILRFKLKDVVDMVAPIIEGILKDKKEVSLKVHIADDLEIYGDLGLIRQVLINLLGNSVKFTSSGIIELSAWKGNGTFDVRQHSHQSAGTERFVTVAISDSGIGIRPEDQLLIFEPFQQADASIKSTYGGTGLGLAIVRKIVELHQGRIWVESEVGKGSCFYFTVPQFHFTVAAQEETTEMLRLQESVLQSSTDQAQLEPAIHPLTADRLYPVAKQPELARERKGRGEHILIIDDSETSIQLACTRLEVAGYRVHFAQSAAEAWELLEKQSPGKQFDLILLDVMMPDINGYEFCQRLRSYESYRNTKRIPVIMLTAKATLEDKIYGLNVGADDYLIKPYNADELTARVYALLRMQRLYDVLAQKNKELETLFDITSAVREEIGVDHLLMTILDRMLELVQAERGCAFTFENGAKEVTLRFSRGFTSRKRSEVVHAVSRMLIKAAIDDDQICIIPDIESDKGRTLVEKRGSLICMPLRLRDKPFGCLYLYASQRQRLKESLLPLLSSIGHQLSYMLYHARIYDLAITDDLTHLHQKRHFMEMLQLEFDRLKNESTGRFAVVMIDIDHFKSFNDRYGHPLGDAILIQLAELLQHSCRLSDVAARYGGEEFVVLLRNTDLKEAAAFAERYRRIVEGFNFYRRGKALRLTVSVGVCAYEEAQTITPEAMIELVDFELYRAKASGRNRTSIRDFAESVNRADDFGGFLEAPAHRAQPTSHQLPHIPMDIAATMEPVTLLGHHPDETEAGEA